MGQSSITGDESITFTDNMSFDGTERGGKMTTDGQLWIGSTAARHVKLGSITSPNGSITIGYLSPNITLTVAGGTTTVVTLTGDDSVVVSPTAGNINVIGRAGSKTSGSGSTLTISSPPFSQVGGSGTSVLNSGEFVTATATRTLPATAGLVNGDLVIYYATTANVLTVTANTGQTIRVGSAVSASAGTAASTAIGDSLTLRFDATAVSWRAVSVVGNWIIT